VYAIASRQDEEGFHWNPVRTGLKDLGLLGDKSTGIPAVYMQADEDTRLAVIAGLIESDGCYVKSHRTYRFTQRTQGHKKIVYDLKDLALSCGISVTGVDENQVEQGFDRIGPRVPQWICYLGRGSIKFQHHLLVPRKRMTFERQYYNHGLRVFKVADVPDGQYRAIEVSGGKYQLHNRLVVENCHRASSSFFTLCSSLSI
jgi:glutamate synthase (NADPH/NADH)